MGRKNKVFRIIVVVFLILFSLLEVVAIIYYLDNFINGFTPSDIVGNVTEDTVYGFQAIKQDGWTHLITFPIIHLASAIQVLYGAVSITALNVDEVMNHISEKFGQNIRFFICLLCAR